jgi:hypothetical protein
MKRGSDSWLAPFLPTQEYWVVEIKFHVFLTSAVDGGEWSVSLNGDFTLDETAGGIRWLDFYNGPRINLDTLEKDIAFVPARNWMPDSLLTSSYSNHYMTQVFRRLIVIDMGLYV